MCVRACSVCMCSGDRERERVPRKCASLVQFHAEHIRVLLVADSDTNVAAVVVADAAAAAAAATTYGPSQTESYRFWYFV